MNNLLIRELETKKKLDVDVPETETPLEKFTSKDILAMIIATFSIVMPYVFAIIGILGLVLLFIVNVYLK